MPHRHNVMKPRHKMAAVSAVAPHWPAARVRHLAFIYMGDSSTWGTFALVNVISIMFCHYHHCIVPYGVFVMVMTVMVMTIVHIYGEKDG